MIWQRLLGSNDKINWFVCAEYKNGVHAIYWDHSFVKYTKVEVL